MLLGFSAFVSAGDEEAGDKDDNWPENKARACAIAIQYEYSRG